MRNMFGGVAYSTKVGASAGLIRRIPSILRSSEPYFPSLTQRGFSVQQTQSFESQNLLIPMGSYRDAYFVPRDTGLAEAKHWLAENGSHVHPAFSLLSPYDKQRAQPRPQKQQQ